MHVQRGEIHQLGLPAHQQAQESVLTVGSFDGIHIGHQALIGQIVARAADQGRLAGLITFDPHPAAVLHPQRPLYILTTTEEKVSLVASSGLDMVGVLAFTPQLAATPPRTFVQHLCEQLGMRELWVGPDFALGRNREGDLDALRRLGQELGFAIHNIPYVTQAGQDAAAEGNRVSSSHIRALIREGRVVEAARLLGRHYGLSGRVVHGAQRGRDLGFPTANLDVRPERVVPAKGVYATYVHLGPDRYPSVTNIGVRPSFDHGAQSIEAYILDYSGDLYGRDVAISFVARLRPELRFDSVQALIAQMDRDVLDARQILANQPPAGQGLGDQASAGQALADQAGTSTPHPVSGALAAS
jgi:riboflavin kinase/FMN adenylyltransferase